MRHTFVILGLFSGAFASGCIDLQTVDEGTGGNGGTSSSSSSSSGTGGAASVQLPAEWQAGEPSGTEYTLPAWLIIECSTANRTTQWSASTIRRGYGINAARPRRVIPGPSNWGLSVESPRKNHIENSDSWSGQNWIDPAPIKVMSASAPHPDPAGEMKATVFSSTGGQQSLKTEIPMGYASSWLRGEGTAPYAYLTLDVGNGSASYTPLQGGPTWQRLEAGEGGGAMYLDTVGNMALGVPPINTANSIYAYAAQLETDQNGNVVKYPASYIPNIGSERRVRNADTLYSTSTPDLLPDGYFHVILKIAPNYASDEYFFNYHQVLYLNSSNQLRFDLKDGRLSLQAGANTLSGPVSGTLSWAREQELTIEVSVNPGGRTLSLTGATSGDFTVSDKEDRPWPTTQELYILGDTGGAPESADLRYIGFFPPN